MSLALAAWPAPRGRLRRKRASDKVFVGYLYGQPRDINFRLYTHLCHAFLVADGDGNLREVGNRPEP